MIVTLRDITQRQEVTSFLFSVFAYFLAETVQLISNEEIPSHIQLFVKCLPLLSLIVYVYRVQGSYNAMKKNPEALKILLGLVLCAIGDGFLVYQNIDMNYFIAGLILFLIAHILYMNAFGWKKFDLPTLVVCIAMTFATMYMIFVKYGISLDPVLQGSCIIYSAVIYLMAWRSWARLNFSQEKNHLPHVYAGIGTLCFVVSDTLLAINKFAFPLPGAHYTIMSAYYAAQFFIAISVPNPDDSFINADVKKKMK